MDIYYLVEPEESSDGSGVRPDRMLRRQEASSLSRAGAMERIALQEAISMVRLGVGGHVRIPHERDLEDVVTRAVACAEIMALGTPVTIGKKLVTADPEPGSPQDRAFEATQERHRLLPPAAGAEGGDAYISPGWPTDEECARLAHKIVHEMGYSQANVARIFELVDGYERPAMWTRQGINRILWEECDGEKYPRSITGKSLVMSHAVRDGCICLGHLSMRWRCLAMKARWQLRRSSTLPSTSLTTAFFPSALGTRIEAWPGSCGRSWTSAGSTPST
ncbi:hypothetical protein ACFQ9Z_38590 [Streptomyces sp. NPDC056580]|uniref:hypothetical protein n=1 Tax=Streptomyces sp. NPDC056580 TaxID=3345872 RepID=UPI0036BCE521